MLEGQADPWAQGEAGNLFLGSDLEGNLGQK